MDPLQRVTAPTVDVLEVLLRPAGSVWGLFIVKETGRPTGTVYPILERLEHLGWLEASWEEAPDRNGPRRRFYSLTDDGKAAAAAAVEVFHARQETQARTKPRLA
ncbi:PadR family transcriptional regulator [Amnibacterium flavum]|uniref:PadR family transcriptional regulator n=1 Tax=Amnibacterium flavum TaxID=2173173 RepID=A0A2V1HT96_9MICO|nr:helix-turn-helix transcriptional regulator [Amnibacterium flavum]PVZ93314.1 PadR family transcriptional regulator [Amnibacterium flavum]